MTHSHTKIQVQRSVGSTDRVETNGQTDRRTDIWTLQIALTSPLTPSVKTKMNFSLITGYFFMFLVYSFPRSDGVLRLNLATNLDVKGAV